MIVVACKLSSTTLYISVKMETLHGTVEEEDHVCSASLLIDDPLN